MSRDAYELPSIELWAGVEPTVNRVGDQFFDQLARSGHATRLDDLRLFADLGIRTLRYPVLWERTAPDGLDRADWSWADERLGRLRELGIRPIVGLVHHGSGPRSTSLVDPAFADGLAAFAGAVARRYPWIEDYTPVNEPLTTARFSGLYGHWYPHGADGLTFGRALLTQCRAVVLAMRAIRAVNPAARLIQTEDLAKTFSTPPLAYQADFENARRWATFDLLGGRLDHDHPLRSYFRWIGIDDRDLDWFLEHPCPPDILGLNYYVTGERFLDHRLERYPAAVHGGNGREAYADVEAVRVAADGLAGPAALLREAWERYRRPLAVTEAHLGCTREEQLRWFMEFWEAAHALRGAGVDIRAVTAWTLLGSYDWNSMVTRNDGHYEPGVFDVRAPQPRPTALAHMVRTLSAGRPYDHPVLATPGWWRRPERLLYPPVDCQGPAEARSGPVAVSDDRPVRPLAIIGASSTLGRAFARLCERRGLPYRLLTRQEVDIAEPDSVAAMLDELRPWAVINIAGYRRVDAAEREPERCFRKNADGPAVLAAACAQQGVALVTFSSDLVFDGTKREPYRESDPVAPLSVYGRSQAAAEERVLAALPAALIIRTGALFGPWDEHNLVTIALRALAAGQSFVAADDITISPTYVPDLVHTTLDLLIDGEQGVWHLANAGAVTWAEFARRAATCAGLDPAGVEGWPAAALGYVAPRPAYSVLGSERETLLPGLDDALARYVAESDFLPEVRARRTDGVLSQTPAADQSCPGREPEPIGLIEPAAVPVDYAAAVSDHQEADRLSAD